MHVADVGLRRRQSGADGPDRLVGDNQAGGLFRRDFVKGAETLAAQDIVGESGFAFFEDFSNADDGNESGFEGGFKFEVDGVIGFAEVLAPFAVPDDHPTAPHRSQHRCGDFPGIGAFVQPENILRSDLDRA